MSSVVRSGLAPAGVRRLALPVLCASLLAVPMVALPAVAGTALADAPVEQTAAVEQTPVEPVAAEEPVAEEAATATEAAVEDIEAEPVVTPAAPTAAPAAAATPAPVKTPERATINPVDPGVGPVPDDVERPDLVVAVDGPASGFAGGEGAYTLSVANAATATAPASDFTLVYSVPPGQTVLSVDAPYDSDWACVLGTQASCTWGGELAAGAQAAPVTVLVGHGRRAQGRMTGTATVSHLDGEVVLADNTATVVTAMEAPDLALNVTAPVVAAAGETVSMVLSVTNVGPGWVSTFALHGSVSDGVSVSDLSGAGFACDVASLSCRYDDELAPGLSAAVTLTGVVDAAHAGGPLTTTAQIDQAALLASAQTSVSAAKPAAAPPVVAPPAAAPVVAAPVAPVRAVKPVAVMPVAKPVRVTAPREVAVPAAASSGRPATLPFADGPSTLPFTGASTGAMLGGGAWLILVGVLLVLAPRRRTA